MQRPAGVDAARYCCALCACLRAVAAAAASATSTGLKRGSLYILNWRYTLKYAQAGLAVGESNWSRQAPAVVALLVEPRELQFRRRTMRLINVAAQWFAPSSP